jgi:hypothetical protein
MKILNFFGLFSPGAKEIFNFHSPRLKILLVKSANGTHPIAVSQFIFYDSSLLKVKILTVGKTFFLTKKSINFQIFEFFSARNVDYKHHQLSSS